RSSSYSQEQTFWRESDKSQGFGDGVPEAGAGMPLGTVPLSASSTGSGVSPTILPIDSATEPQFQSGRRPRVRGGESEIGQRNSRVCNSVGERGSQLVWQTPSLSHPEGLLICS